MNIKGKDIKVSTLICPCSNKNHAKAHMIEKTTNNNKKQYFCVQNNTDGATCDAIGFICEQTSLKCVCCFQ